MVQSVRLGLTLGLIWGVNMLLLSVVSSRNYGGALFHSMEKLYPGCSSTSIKGRVICGLMGFADAFMLGLIIGLVYNRLGMVKM